MLINKAETIFVKYGLEYLVLCLLLLQLIGSYYASEYFVFNGFMVLWVVLRIVFPVIFLAPLKIPLHYFNIRKPERFKHDTLFYLVIVAMFVGLYLFFKFAGTEYLSYYTNGFSFDSKRRFIRFLLFTTSTLVGWEVLHRVFLLGGMRYTLSEKMGVSLAIAERISIITVCVFEVLYHLQKPIYESVSMVLASVFLTKLTLLCRSIVPALLIHLVIEIMFGYATYVGF